MPDVALLERYAEVAVKIGVGLSAGDRLHVVAPIEAADLTRAVVAQAYEAGAATVDVQWTDEAVARARFERGSAEASQVVSTAALARLAAFEAGDLMLYIVAADPEAMAGLDPVRLADFQRVTMSTLEPLYQAQGRLKRPWSVLAAPSERWARSVFPDAADAQERLWSAIFRACRVDADDPIGAWRSHVADLDARGTHLTSRGYTALRYEAPGTDLRLGLPERATWRGGTAGSGFVPNIPTEEVFAAPHRLVGEGTVRATKPLSLYGNLVTDFSFEVREGRIVEATAGTGQDVLDQVLATDDGAIRFGETAMVPMSSAVAREALVWNNTLYDENDGCHIAFGRSYPISIEGGSDMSEDELLAAGLNQSTVHVDFVVGSPDLNVFGIRPDGSEEPIITRGEWGFVV